MIDQVGRVGNKRDGGEDDDLEVIPQAVEVEDDLANDGLAIAVGSVPGHGDCFVDNGRERGENVKRVGAFTVLPELGERGSLCHLGLDAVCTESI